MSKALEEEEGRQGLVASEQPWKRGLSQRSGQQKGRGRQRCEKGHRVGRKASLQTLQRASLIRCGGQSQAPGEENGG